AAAAVARPAVGGPTRNCSSARCWDPRSPAHRCACASPPFRPTRTPRRRLKVAASAETNVDGALPRAAQRENRRNLLGRHVLGVHLVGGTSFGLLLGPAVVGLAGR